MADTLTLYKLIVLKMLDEADAPLTGAQITDFILEKEYTNYFTLQQVLSEMSETGLVTVAPPETAPSIGSQIPADIP